MNLIDNAVALADVAEHIKSTPAAVEAEAQALRLHIGVDWRGDPAVSTADAHALASGELRRSADHDAAWAAHLAATEQWEAARRDVSQAAYTAAYAAAARAGLGNPKANAAGTEAASDAARRFEKETPAPQFRGEATALSWFARAANSIRFKEAVR